MSFDVELNRTLDRYAPELIALAGFLRNAFTMHPITADVLSIFILHWFLPSVERGFMVCACIRRRLAYGVKVSGCTVHFADQEYDHGPIILQRVVPVLTMTRQSR